MLYEAMIGSIDTISQMQKAVRDWRADGLQVALVPTMGGLHEGHLALVAEAVRCYDRVVVSIYVNPTQFAAHEDLDSYPRMMDDDRAALAPFGDDVVIFAPQTLYQPAHATMIQPQGAALPLEGAHRPHFFAGVATVVFRLFQAVPAHAAYFGEKDFQQLAVIRQMVHDFDLPISVIAVPTIRAQDGLALSSRNLYLSAEERAVAPFLYSQMKHCAAALSDGQPMAKALDEAQAKLQAAGFGQIDYFGFYDATTLAPIDEALADCRLMAAIWLGETRLIDNESYQNLCAAQ